VKTISLSAYHSSLGLLRNCSLMDISSLHPHHSLKTTYDLYCSSHLAVPEQQTLQFKLRHQKTKKKKKTRNLVLCPLFCCLISFLLFFLTPSPTFFHISVILHLSSLSVSLEKRIQGLLRLLHFCFIITELQKLK